MPASTLRYYETLGLVPPAGRTQAGCCMFFRFAITVDERGVALEVTAPADAQALVVSLFGVPR